MLETWNLMSKDRYIFYGCVWKICFNQLLVTLRSFFKFAHLVCVTCSVCICVCTNCQSDKLSMGTEGIHQLSRWQQGCLGGKNNLQRIQYAYSCHTIHFPSLMHSSFPKFQEYDATCLISKYNNLPATILIDQVKTLSPHVFACSFVFLFVEPEPSLPQLMQGDSDKFYPHQLLPSNFEEACKKVNVPLLLRVQPGYDHSFYFIATFMEDHISHHAQALKI